MGMTVTRRTALKGLGAIAGTAAASQILPACDSPPSETMVFMMMENRTYDHFLGSRAMFEGLPGDGLKMGMALPDMDGNMVGLSNPALDAASLCVLDPPHEWDPSHMQFNNGANDGFVRAFQQVHPGTTGGVVMEYMRREQLPVFYALADAYTTCDRWFASLMGPTLPNRMYWMSAQSNGAKGNDEVIAGAFKGIPTIFDRLDAAGVAWKYYYGDFPILGFLPQYDYNDKRIAPFVNDYLNDAKAGKLPPVVFIDPSFTFNDYHPPHHPFVAEQLLAATYNALATGPQWEKSSLVITFDEHGGFFDHVPPGKAPDERAADGFDQLGFRVPPIIIGPHARNGYVDSTVRDHTSALKHIQKKFGLPSLTMRDAAANDLSSCFDPLSEPSKPITLPTVEVDESMLDNCMGKAFDLHVVLQWAERMKLDVPARQRQARDHVYAIGEYLDQHGLGRIRRGR
jgi:phospholipase C